MLDRRCVACQITYCAALEVLLSYRAGGELLARRHAQIAAGAAKRVVSRQNQTGDQMGLSGAGSDRGAEYHTLRKILLLTAIGPESVERSGFGDRQARGPVLILQQRPLGEN